MSIILLYNELYHFFLNFIHDFFQIDSISRKDEHIVPIGKTASEVFLTCSCFQPKGLHFTRIVLVIVEL